MTREEIIAEINRLQAMLQQFNEPNTSEEVFNRPVNLNKKTIGYTQSRIEQLLAGATPRSAKEAATRQALLRERGRGSMRIPPAWS